MHRPLLFAGQRRVIRVGAMVDIVPEGICLAVLRQAMGAQMVAVGEAEPGKDNVQSHYPVGCALLVGNEAVGDLAKDTFVRVRDMGCGAWPLHTPVRGFHLLWVLARLSIVPQADHGMPRQVKLGEVLGLPHRLVEGHSELLGNGGPHLS